MAEQNVLVVEDDEVLIDAIARKFAGAGFSVDRAITGEQARDEIQTKAPDLIVLDLMLPDDDGIDICRDVRARSDVPVIMLTARTEVSDRITGLEVGADDYITKPFSLSELVARVRAVLRRVEREPRDWDEGEGEEQKKPAQEEKPAILQAAGVRVDQAAHDVTVDGSAVSLTPTEYDLLVTLMRHNGEAVSSAKLLEEVWGPEQEDTHLLQVHIGNLRRKLRAASDGSKPITTVREYGYRIG